MKEVLIIYYSQTGQLFDILQNVASTISDEKVNISYCEIIPKKKFPFPWKQEEFYGAFPETFLQIPTPLEAISAEILQKKYDLVILGYTTWYLTPSIPINSFLKSEEAKLLLANTPVITVSASRNMWIMAQEKVKKLLVVNNAKLVGNIALVDRNMNHISVITIVHWLIGGKKTKMLGIFPKPGVSDKDIAAASRFGVPIKEALLQNEYSNLQQNLLEVGAVKIDPSLIATDIRGNVVFTKWANHLIKKEGEERKKWLVYFKYYLLFAIWLIAPIVFIVFLLTYIPMYRKIQRDKAYYLSVALKQD
ncbi:MULTISPECIES: dialkylrecorsinol condensing enzyme DarA [Aequorivita]|uniref:Dialkylresorcinol condensing enzyme DarA n=1 Tax=Aequorivita iocasae TaxID=2803865 RepID=A0ABX7DVQ8_9FLAO|nr:MULTISPECIES: dialkylrecorsinol condensing enzyme DarA [Aequorivita]QQX77860.1 dialkylresorcinol condensing enzyme DarA [Aequorivita iocasae]UCA57360.1 dialkylresorcinol condensing enzyme DarA [Aequorivita sp. F7]